MKTNTLFKIALVLSVVVIPTFFLNASTAVYIGCTKIDGDCTPPSMSAITISPLINGYVGDSFSISGSASDSGVGLKNIYVYLDNVVIYQTTSGSYSVSCSSTNVKCNPSYWAAYESHTIVVTASDYNSNTASRSVVVTKYGTYIVASSVSIVQNGVKGSQNVKININFVNYGPASSFFFYLKIKSNTYADWDDWLLNSYSGSIGTGTLTNPAYYSEVISLPLDFGAGSIGSTIGAQTDLFAFNTGTYVIDGVYVTWARSHFTTSVISANNQFTIWPGRSIFSFSLFDPVYTTLLSSKLSMTPGQYLTYIYSQKQIYFTNGETDFSSRYGMKFYFYTQSFTYDSSQDIFAQMSTVAKSDLGLPNNWVLDNEISTQNHGFDMLMAFHPASGSGGSANVFGANNEILGGNMFHMGMPTSSSTSDMYWAEAATLHETIHTFGMGDATTDQSINLPHIDPNVEGQGYLMSEITTWSDYPNTWRINWISENRINSFRDHFSGVKFVVGNNYNAYSDNGIPQSMNMNDIYYYQRGQGQSVDTIGNSYGGFNFMAVYSSTIKANSNGQISFNGWFRQYDTFTPDLQQGRRELEVYVLYPSTNTIVTSKIVLDYTSGTDWQYVNYFVISGLSPGAAYKIGFGRPDSWSNDWQLTAQFEGVTIYGSEIWTW